MKNICTLEMPVFRWRQLVKMMHPLCSEFPMDISSEKLRIAMVDPAHVVMLVVELHPRLFKVFDVQEPVRIGWDLSSLERALRFLDGSDMFSLMVLDDLHCDVEAEFEFGVYRKHIRLPDIGGIPDPKVPNLDLERTLDVDPRGFGMAVRKMTLSDYLCLMSSGKDLIVECEGDTDNEHIALDVLNPLKKRGKKYRSLFNIDYMNNIIRTAPKEMRQLTMRLGMDNPVELKYVEKDKDEQAVMEAMFLLAPRIESE